MSKAKISFINKEKVDKALKERSPVMLQKELAELIGMSPEALNRSLKRGRISVYYLEQIGLQLDLAPEYLSDNPSLFPGAPINYALHLSQEEHGSREAIIRALWTREGFNPNKIAPDDFWGLYFAIAPAIDEYIQSYREKISNKEEEE